MLRPNELANALRHCPTGFDRRAHHRVAARGRPEAGERAIKVPRTAIRRILLAAGLATASPASCARSSSTCFSSSSLGERVAVERCRVPARVAQQPLGRIPACSRIRSTYNRRDETRYNSFSYASLYLPPSPLLRLRVPTALVGGRLIDGFGGPPLANSVILIDNERITAIGQVGTPRPFRKMPR